jgi:hypothetical protein
MNKLKMAFEMVMSCDDTMNCGSAAFAKALEGQRESIVVVRIKDRFGSPTSGGWTDCMINFYFANDPNRHVCELQLIHEEMMTVRREMKAHAGYVALSLTALSPLILRV